MLTNKDLLIYKSVPPKNTDKIQNWTRKYTYTTVNNTVARKVPGLVKPTIQVWQLGMFQFLP